VAFSLISHQATPVTPEYIARGLSFNKKAYICFPFFSFLLTRHSLNTFGNNVHPTGNISTLQVSLFMQEGIQVDGARVVLPQPVSTGAIPQVGTVTSYSADGQHSPPIPCPPSCMPCLLPCLHVHSQSNQPGAMPRRGGMSGPACLCFCMSACGSHI